MIPSGYFMWHSLRTQHEDFNSRRQTVWSPKNTPSTQHHRQYKSVDYTHSAKPALLLETSCQFSTGTGILVSMKLSCCWRAPRGLLSMRRMGLFWIVSTRSRWGKKTKQNKNRRTKNNRHVATKCFNIQQLQLSTSTMSLQWKDNLQIAWKNKTWVTFQIDPHQRD